MYSRCTFTCALGALVSSTTACVEEYSIRHYVTKLSETCIFLFELVVVGGVCRSEHLASKDCDSLFQYQWWSKDLMYTPSVKNNYHCDTDILIKVTQNTHNHPTLYINYTKKSLSLILYDGNCYFSMLIILMGKNNLFFYLWNYSVLIAIATDPNFHNKMP